MEERNIANLGVRFISPAGSGGAMYNDRKWVSGTLVLTNMNLWLVRGQNNIHISMRTISDIERKKGVLQIDHYEGNTVLVSKIAAPANVLDMLEMTIIRAPRPDWFKVYYISPASRGGVLLTEIGWTKGLLAIAGKSVWLVGRDSHTRIPFEKIISLERKEIRLSEDDSAVSINHYDAGEALSSLIACPAGTMDMVTGYISTILARYETETNLSDVEDRIVTLLYIGGFDSTMMEDMLECRAEELDGCFDHLIRLKLAKIVRLRREPELTTEGMKYVTDLSKDGRFGG
jgi:helix-turn-helix protein